MPTIEEARVLLKAAADQSSVRAVARDAGVGHTVLLAFLSGQTGKPRGDALARMLAHAGRLAAAAGPPVGNGVERSPPPATASPETAAQEGAAARSSTAMQLPPSDATIAIPRDMAFYWAGQLDMARHMLRALDTSVLAMSEQLAVVTRGVAGSMESGVLPGATQTAAQWQRVPLASDADVARVEAQDRALHEAEMQRARAAEQAAGRGAPPARRRAAGGG